MMKLEKLEEDIQRLGRKKLAVLREWFQRYDADEWDRQIEEDVSCGNLDILARDATASYKTGKIKEL